MRHFPFLEHGFLAAGLFAAAHFGLQALQPVVQAAFVGGLFFLYGLGRSRSSLRWKWGPPVLRLTCWLSYAVLLCRLGGSQVGTLSLPTMGLLLLTLFGTTAWGLIRCFGASRNHVTDGNEDTSRDDSLTSMLRALGLARGTALMVVLWVLVSLGRVASGLEIWGQDLAMTALLCALAVSESVTSLVFGERVCTCCGTPPAASAVMLARAIGLGLVVAGWAGSLAPAELVMQVGAMLYAMAVLSSGSPATLPVQFQPKVVGDSRMVGVLAQHFRHKELLEDVAELKTELQNVREELAVKNLAEDKPIVETMKTDAITLEVGRQLLPMVQREGKGTKLLDRITSVRRHVAQELGLVLPEVRFSDNLQLQPDTYVIKLREVEVGQGEVFPGLFLAIGPEEKLKKLNGKQTVDPTYGMPGVWIDQEQRSTAERQGCMIFDSVSVMATQLTEVVRSSAEELLGVGEVAELLANLENRTLVDQVYPDFINLVKLRDILRGLLAERVTIRDLEFILETLAGNDPNLDTEHLVEIVRVAMGRTICADYQNNEGTINVVTIAPDIEKQIQSSITRTESGSFLTIDPNVGQAILHALSVQVEELQEKGLQPIVLCSPPIRPALRKLTERSFPNLVLLSWNEIAPKVNVNSVAMAEL